MFVQVSGCQVLAADAGKDTTLCAGNDVILGGIVTASGGLPPYTYQWSAHPGLSNPAIANPTGRFSNPTSMALTVTDSRGKQAKDTVVIQAISCPPLVVRAGKDTTVCEGSSLKIGGSPAVTGGVAPLVLEWIKGAGMDNIHLANPQVTPVSSDIYVLRVTDAMMQEGKDTVMVHVATNPAIPVISQNGNILNSAAASRYQWYLDDVMLPDQQSQSIEVRKSGSYKVRITNDNGCIAWSSPVSSIYTSVDNPLPSEPGYRIYPNPVTSDATLEFTSSVSTFLSVTLYDLHGRRIGMLLERQMITGNNTHRFILPFATYKLPSGFYVLQLKTGTEIIIRRIYLSAR